VGGGRGVRDRRWDGRENEGESSFVSIVSDGGLCISGSCIGTLYGWLSA
jgi:hypothetical protein